MYACSTTMSDHYVRPVCPTTMSGQYVRPVCPTTRLLCYVLDMFVTALQSSRDVGTHTRQYRLAKIAMQRMQNDSTTLQALACRYMPYTVFSSLFYFAHLLYWKTAMIKTISKCTTDTPKSTSRIVSMRRYALTFHALALRSSVDTIRALSLY